MKKFIIRAGSLILCLIFIVGSLVAFFLTKNASKKKSAYPEVTATITQIEEIQGTYDYDTNSYDYTYIVHVSYTYNGQEYNAESDFYKSGYEAGQEITIRVNPDNPTDISDAAGSGMYWFFLVFTAVGVIGLVIFLFKRR